MSIVDAHAHIVGGDQSEWSAEDLVANMDLVRVNKAVLVQYSSVHGYDNTYVLESARRYPQRFVPVVTVASADELNRSVESGAAGLRLRAPSRGASLDWLTDLALWQRAT